MLSELNSPTEKGKNYVETKENGQKKKNIDKASPKLLEKSVESSLSTPHQVNILDLLSDELEPVLERVRLDGNETAIVFFTQKGEPCTVHFCDEPEIQDYLLCRGPDCLLCRIGRKHDGRLLLPVYLPTSHCVAVLPVSTSFRPKALLPQIGAILKAKKPMVAFISRSGPKYTVSTSELPDDADGGETEIKNFLEDYDAKKIRLTSVFQRLENEQLASVQGVAETARLKGIKI